MISETWDKGRILVGTVTTASARYVSEYCVKKMTGFDDVRLDGRVPEFMLSSRRPGIGVPGLRLVADPVVYYGSGLVDVPQGVIQERRLLPLDRVRRRKLRVMTGRLADCPQEVVTEIEQEMLGVRLAAREDDVEPAVKAHWEIANAGNIASFEARSEIARQKKLRKVKL